MPKLWLWHGRAAPSERRKRARTRIAHQVRKGDTGWASLPRPGVEDDGILRLLRGRGLAARESRPRIRRS